MKRKISFIGLGKMGNQWQEYPQERVSTFCMDLVVKPVNELVGLGAIGKVAKELGQN
jgi:hypothetical protein